MTAGRVATTPVRPRCCATCPKAQSLLGDRGYDSDWFRDALQAEDIQPCIPVRRSRNEPVRYDKRHYRLEIMSGRLEDWRRVATRCDRCHHLLALINES